MASFNRTILLGNLTGDPEIRMVGEAELVKYTIAVNSPWKKGKVLFMDCDHWRAGKVAEFLARGTPVLVEGELDQQSWEKDGQKRSKVVLQVQHLQLVGRKDREPEEELATDFA